MTIQAFIPSSEMIFTTVENDRRRFLEYCLSLKQSELRLDLGNVSHCDSAGLAFLIDAKRLARNHKKSCHIEGMTKAIQALAEFCGVDKMLMNDNDGYSSSRSQISEGGFVSSALNFSDEPFLSQSGENDAKSNSREEFLHDK